MFSKKVVILLAVLVFLASGYFSFSYFSPETISNEEITALSVDDAVEIDTSGPATEECPLNGKMLSKKQEKRWEKRRPLGIMIENHLDARPQSGLSNADIIYEAVAEGGITRFLAIFYCQDSKIVGPVRSARIYFIKLLQEYGRNPLYAHVGGANTPGPADALGEIRDLGWDVYNDMNQFSVPFPYFYRDYERLPDRATEHTMYSSTSKLWQYAKAKRKLSNKDEDRKSWDDNFKKWKFKNDAKLNDRGTVSKINFDFWSQFGSTYSVSWMYDKNSNSYKRVNGGRPHIDKNTGKQMQSKNIFVIFADERSANDGYPGGHILYKVTGSGEGLFFQNGKVIKGTWRKKDEESRMAFLDGTGQEISIVRGQVFIEVLPDGNKVVY